MLFIITLYTIQADTDVGSIRKGVKHFLSHSVSVCTGFLYEDSSNNCNYISNHSKFKIYFDTTTDKNRHTTTSLSLRAKVGLPKISNRLFFTLDKESTTSQENRDKNEVRDLSSDDSTRVGLKYYFKRNEDTKVFAKLGAKLRFSDKSDIYIKLGANNLKRFKNFDLYSYANEYYYIRSKIFKTQIGANIIKNLNNTFTLFFNNEIHTQTHENHFLDNTIMLNQYLKNRATISYWTTLVSEYDGSLYANSISANIKYHKMINDWVFYEISPSIVKSLTKEREVNKYLHINFGFIF